MNEQQKALVERVRRLPLPDCGDNSCRFATKRGGMRTNGGCSCLTDLYPRALRTYLTGIVNALPDLLSLIDSQGAEIERLTAEVTGERDEKAMIARQFGAAAEVAEVAGVQIDDPQNTFPDHEHLKNALADHAARLVTANEVVAALKARVAALEQAGCLMWLPR